MRRMDVAARYGGDEFVLLIPHAGIDEATLIAERIREEFKQASAGITKRTSGVSMSIGISSMNAHRPNGAEQLVALADNALYRAKENGRDCIASADVSIPRTVNEAAILTH
jgi:diguanylate cyclase (GGDEF)-like protein